MKKIKENKKVANELPEIKVKTVTDTVYRNIRFEDCLTLRVDKLSYLYEVTERLNLKKSKKYEVLSKKEISKEVEELSFHLKPVTVAELAAYRNDNISSFVLVKNGEFYWTKIPGDISFYSSKLLGGFHLCSESKKECSRLSAASDDLGGCAKVRSKATGIEKFPWITSGYETFGTSNDSFFVACCEHYKTCPEKATMSVEARNRAKLALAQFVWDDVESMEEVRRRFASAGIPSKSSLVRLSEQKNRQRRYNHQKQRKDGLSLI